MPALTIDGLRANRHSLRGYLSIFKGTTIVTATVSATPSTYPVSSLSMTISIGSHTNIERGAEVIITSAGGLYKGRLRVRASGTLNSTTLPIAEVSQASVTIVSGDILKVLSEHRIRPKFPKADETFDPDWLTYSDQGSAVPPMALSGGPVAAFVDDGETYATLDFDGTASYAADPDSGGSLTHSWAFPAGSTPASSTSATPTGVEIPAGEWWIKHTVTDSSNTKTWTQYVPVWVHDDDNPPQEVIIQSLSGTLADGWTATFSMFESLDQDDAPDGCLVVFWVKEIIDQEEQSFGSKSHSQNKLVGWLRSDEATSNAQEYRLNLTAVSAMARLGEIYGSSKVMLSDSTPTAWSDIDDLSVKLAILQILRWYTTITEVCDVALGEFTNYTYPRFYLQKNTPLEAVRELADAVDARVACDRTGRIEVQLRPELTPRADRNTIATTLALADQDIISVTVRREHYKAVDLLEVRGIRYDADTPLFSRYPGNAPGEGSQNTVQDKLITANQSDLNKRAGLRGGFLDRVYIDTDGTANHAPQIQIVLFGSYDVFDFYREWIAINLDETSNWRGVNLDTFRWMLQSVQVEYIGGTATITLDLQAETGAPDGVTYIPPAPPVEMIPDYDWTMPSFPPIDTEQSWVRATDNIVAVTEDGHLFSTNNFTSAPPTWTDVDISGDLGGEDVLQFAVDPRSPTYQGTGSEVNGWIVTQDGVYYVEDLFSATPTVSLEYAFPLGANAAVGIDINYTSDPGNFGVVVYGAAESNKKYRCATYDGAGWAEQAEPITDSNTSPGGKCAVSIDPHSGNDVYVFETDSKLMVSSGASDFPYDAAPAWANIETSGMGGFLYMPFAVNPARVVYYQGGGALGSLTRGFLNAGSSVMDITPTWEGDGFGVLSGRYIVSSPSGNANLLMACGFGGGGTAALLSRDALDPAGPTWEPIYGPVSGPPSGTRLNFRRCAMIDPDGAGAYLWGEAAHSSFKSAIGFWDGTEVLDKRGSTFTNQPVIAIAGG